jgi:hypothetical protein
MKVNLNFNYLFSSEPCGREGVEEGTTLLLQGGVKLRFTAWSSSTPHHCWAGWGTTSPLGLNESMLAGNHRYTLLLIWPL